MRKLSSSLLSLCLVLAVLAPARSAAQVTSNCPGISMDLVWGCLSTTSGWASVDEVSGATNPISILWSTGQTSQYVSGLSNGEHWVMVTDDEGCYVKEMFTVGCWIDPDCTLDLTVEWGCFDTTSAWASVTVTGATGTLETLWSNGATSQYVTGLSSGDHWVWVQEAHDCWVKKSFTIDCEMDPNCPLVVDLETGCNDMGGWATINSIIGSNEATEVHWSTGEQTMSVSGLSNGMYYLVVLNSENCWRKEHFVIDCGPVSDCLFDATVEFGCMDTTSGWASVAITGDPMNPTTTLWSNGATEQYVPGLPNGDHWVMVTDASDCSVQKHFTIACEMDPNCPLVVDMENGCDNMGGWATINEIIGANASTEVHWSTGEQTMSVSSLTNGLHYLVVLNSETCWRKEHFVVDCGPVSDCTFDAMVEFGCMDTTSAWASVAITGDPMNPTTTLWSNGESVQYVTGLSNGPQWVMVTDSTGCSVQKHFTVACEMDPNCPLEVGLEHGCDADGGHASISGIVGANAMTEVHWSTGEQTMSISDLEDGLYYLVVLNSETCWRKEHFVIECPVVVNAPGGNLDVIAYPMPATNRLNVEIGTEVSGVITLTMMDATGRIMITHGNEAMLAGEIRNIDLPVDRLGNGSYLLSIARDGVIVRTERVMIAR